MSLNHTVVMKRGLLSSSLKIVFSSFVCALMIIVASFISFHYQLGVDDRVDEDVAYVGQFVQEYVKKNSDMDNSDSFRSRLSESDEGETQLVIRVGDNKLDVIKLRTDAIYVDVSGRMNNFKVVGYSDNGKHKVDLNTAAVFEFNKDS